MRIRPAVRLGLVALVAVLGLQVAATSACGPDDAIVACKDIPDGGCPLASGVSCEDPSCKVAYACTAGGTWVVDHACPATDAMIAEPVPPIVLDSSFDAPKGDLNCVTLEMPDCPASLAEQCGVGCCGCENLFVCNQGTWTPYGSCDGDGGIHPGQ
jgi:hypothetical protein